VEENGSRGGNAIAGADDGGRRRKGRGGRGGGRRSQGWSSPLLVPPAGERAITVTRTTKGWENISFWGCLAVFVPSHGSSSGSAGWLVSAPRPSVPIFKGGGPSERCPLRTVRSSVPISGPPCGDPPIETCLRNLCYTYLRPDTESPNHSLPPPQPIPPAMAQVADEKSASVESLQPTPRPLLRSLTLIASCTGAMIVNVSPTPVGPCR